MCDDVAAAGDETATAPLWCLTLVCHVCAGSLWQQMMAADAEAAQQVLDSCQVVAATCIGVGDPVLLARRCVRG